MKSNYEDSKTLNLCANYILLSDFNARNVLKKGGAAKIV